MNLRFSVQSWAAWAPGLASRDAWLAWFAQPVPVQGSDIAPLPQVAAMARRRIERLGRAALQSAFEALDDAAAPCPCVFASRYGDMRRSVELMTQLATEGVVSPTSFSVSVHNAFAALFSIARGDHSNYSAVAAGAESAEHAFIEALGLLAEGAEQVLVVVYDEPLPAPLDHFSAPDDFLRGWACRIAAASDGHGIALHLDATKDEPAPQETALPADLALLRFLACDSQKTHERIIENRRWRWERT